MIYSGLALLSGYEYSSERTKDFSLKFHRRLRSRTQKIDHSGTKTFFRPERSDRYRISEYILPSGLVLFHIPGSIQNPGYIDPPNFHQDTYQDRIQRMRKNHGERNPNRRAFLYGISISQDG